jgi:hypothetical protein
MARAIWGRRVVNIPTLARMLLRMAISLVVIVIVWVLVLLELRDASLVIAPHYQRWLAQSGARSLSS